MAIIIRNRSGQAEGLTLNIDTRNLLQVLMITVLLSTLSPAAVGTELRGTPEELRSYLQSESRTVTLTETATEVAYTDVAKISLIISTKERSLALAMEQNNSLRESVIQQLTQSGVPLDEIRSSKFSASPQFGWFGNSPNSFEVVNSLDVSVSSESDFRLVAEMADEDESIVFGGVEFEHSEKKAYEDKVRDKAIDTLLEQREYFENKLGLKLHPVSFTFSDVRSIDMNRFDMIEEIVVTGSRSQRGDSQNMAAVPPPSFDEIEYRVSATITYEVESSN